MSDAHHMKTEDCKRLISAYAATQPYIDREQQYELVLTDEDRQVILALTAEDMAAIKAGTRRAVLIDVAPSGEAAP